MQQQYRKTFVTTATAKPVFAGKAFATTAIQNFCNSKGMPKLLETTTITKYHCGNYSKAKVFAPTAM